MLKLFVFLAISGTAFAQKPRNLTQEEIKKLEAWREGDQNMWELSGQTEGDMILPDQRNGMIDVWYRWPRGEIPYQIYTSDFNAYQIAHIHAAVQDFARYSCVNVRPRIATDEHYVMVTGNGNGCYAQVGYGRMAGQPLNLSPHGCMYYQTIIHEFLHAIGFEHQQSSSDRDHYVTIMWQNIQPGQQYNFYKYNYVTSFGQPYDYGSIMHYSEKALSANNRSTIVPKDPYWIGKVGLARQMSSIDIAKLNLMYNCYI